MFRVFDVALNIFPLVRGIQVPLEKDYNGLFIIIRPQLFNFNHGVNWGNICGLEMNEDFIGFLFSRCTW